MATSFSGEQADRVRKALETALRSARTGEGLPKGFPARFGNMWVFYRAFLGIPLHEHDWGQNKIYHNIDGGSLDIDCPNSLKYVEDGLGIKTLSPFGQIVYASGAFDLLHIGHIRFLRRASMLGDKLVVGVCTNKMISSYKDPPIIPCLERMEMVRALRFVDEVVPHRRFDDCEWITRYRVTIRAIGPQYCYQSEKQKEVKAELEKQGIHHVVLPRTARVSTTNIRRSCYEQQVKGHSGDPNCGDCHDIGYCTLPGD